MAPPMRSQQPRSAHARMPRRKPCTLCTLGRRRGDCHMGHWPKACQPFVGALAALFCSRPSASSAAARADGPHSQFLRACSKPFHVRASASNGQDRDASRSQNRPSWQGMQHSTWAFASSNGLLGKNSACSLAHARRAASPSVAVFARCLAAPTAFAKSRTQCEDWAQAPARRPGRNTPQMI